MNRYCPCGFDYQAPIPGTDAGRVAVVDRVDGPLRASYVAGDLACAAPGACVVGGPCGLPENPACWGGVVEYVRGASCPREKGEGEEVKLPSDYVPKSHYLDGTFGDCVEKGETVKEYEELRAKLDQLDACCNCGSPMVYLVCRMEEGQDQGRELAWCQACAEILLEPVT